MLLPVAVDIYSAPGYSFVTQLICIMNDSDIGIILYESCQFWLCNFTPVVGKIHIDYRVSYRKVI